MGLLLLLSGISSLFFICAGVFQRWMPSLFGSVKDASNYFFLGAVFDLTQALILLLTYKLFIGFAFYLFLASIWVFLGIVRRIEWKKQMGQEEKTPPKE